MIIPKIMRLCRDIQSRLKRETGKFVIRNPISLDGPCHLYVSLDIIALLKLSIWSYECEVCLFMIEKTFRFIIKVMTKVYSININVQRNRGRGDTSTTTAVGAPVSVTG